jgi:hypothetical protein
LRFRLRTLHDIRRVAALRMPHFNGPFTPYGPRCRAGWEKESGKHVGPPVFVKSLCQGKGPAFHRDGEMRWVKRKQAPARGKHHSPGWRLSIADRRPAFGACRRLKFSYFCSAEAFFSAFAPLVLSCVFNDPFGPNRWIGMIS